MITPSFSLTATERVLPKLALDFTTASLDSRITFTRTTGASNPATYVASTGYVTAATNNQPRFDYDPVALTCKGLLIEESRTNSILQSEDFGTTWTYTRLNTTGTPPWLNVATSPANTLTADKLTEDTNTGSHLTVQTLTGMATTYTFSVYAKKSERFYMAMRLWDGSSNTAFSFFNLNTGVIASTSAGTATITNAGNGWYRCTVTGTLAASASCQTVIHICDDSANLSYTGNGTSGFFVWGAQLEAGAFPTSYIPTTTTALTRNADVATMTGTNFSSWFNASEGSFATETVSPFATQPAGAQAGVFIASDGTMQNYINLAKQSGATNYGMGVTTGNVVQVSINVIGPTTANQDVKCCVAYKLNNFAVSGNANSVTTSSSGTIPTVNNLIIGQSHRLAGTWSFNGYIKKLFYYPQRLINAEVQAFSK